MRRGVRVVASMAFFVGSDFTDASGGTPWGVSPARRIRYVARLLGKAHRLWQEREAIGGKLMRSAEPVARERGGYVANEAHVKRRGPGHTEAGFLAIVDRRSEEAGHILVRFRDEVHASGAFLVVIIPAEFQVDAELLERMRLGPERVDLDRPQRQLRELLDQHGIESLDRLPVFREQGAAERLDWLRNTHWNVAGNALAAQRLARHLVMNVPDLGVR